MVLADEIEQGIVRPAPFPLDITESFYAIVARRSFPHPSIAPLLAATEAGGKLAETGGSD